MTQPTFTFTFKRNNAEPENVPGLRDIRYLGDRFAILIFPDQTVFAVNLGNVTSFSIIPDNTAAVEPPAIIVP
jgi:hypothetical protein